MKDLEEAEVEVCSNADGPLKKKCIERVSCMIKKSIKILSIHSGDPTSP